LFGAFEIPYQLQAKNSEGKLESVVSVHPNAPFDFVSTNGQTTTIRQ